MVWSWLILLSNFCLAPPVVSAFSSRSSSGVPGLGVLGALTFPGICYLRQRPRHCHPLISGEVNMLLMRQCPFRGWAPAWFHCTLCSSREMFFCHSLVFKIVLTVWFLLWLMYSRSLLMQRDFSCSRTAVTLEPSLPSLAGNASEMSAAPL